MAVIGYDSIVRVDSFAGLPTNAVVGQYAFCELEKMLVKWNGTLWSAETRLVVKPSQVTINGKATGATKIYTLEPNSQNFNPVLVVPRVVSVGGVVIHPTISYGSNATAYNNISAASLLSTLLSTLGAGSGAPMMASTSTPLAAGTDIYANVTIPATATGNYSITADIVGYYA